MSPLFADPSLKDIRKAIHETLVETFMVMFQLDVIASPRVALSKSNKTISSYIEMVHQNRTVVLSMETSRTVANMICDKLDPDTKAHSEEMVTDVIAEITNIISNRLRTNLDIKYGMLFKISPPRQSTSEIASSGSDTINVYFDINDNRELDMGMTYKGPNATTARTV